MSVFARRRRRRRRRRRQGYDNTSTFSSKSAELKITSSILTSMRRDDVASTLIRRHSGTKYPLGVFPLLTFHSMYALFLSGCFIKGQFGWRDILPTKWFSFQVFSRHRPAILEVSTSVCSLWKSNTSRSAENNLQAVCKWHHPQSHSRHRNGVLWTFSG